MSDSIEGFVPIAEMSEEQYGSCNFPSAMLRPVELSTGETNSMFHRWMTVKSPLTGTGFKVKGIWRGTADSKQLAGYCLKANVPTLVAGNNCLLRNGVPAACELVVLMLKIWLLDQGVSPFGVDAIDFERMRLTMVTTTFLHRFKTHELARAARIAFQAGLEIRNVGKAKPGKGRKKKAFEVGDSEDRTGYLHERGFDIGNYVKDRDTDTVAVFPSEEARIAVFDEAECELRIETKLEGAWLKKNGFEWPEDWRLYGGERGYQAAYGLIRKSLRLDEGLRSIRPTNAEIGQLCADDEAILRWHLQDENAHQHPCVLAKDTKLKQQQYFSDVKRRIKKKLGVDISVPWEKQVRAFSGGLNEVLQYPGLYTHPPHLEGLAFAPNLVRNAVYELKTILARKMPRTISNIALAPDSLSEPILSIGKLVVSVQARRTIDKWSVPLHSLLGSHKIGVFGDVSQADVVELTIAARCRKPVTSRYSVGDQVILVTTQYVTNEDGNAEPVTNVTQFGERTASPKQKLQATNLVGSAE